MCVFIHVVKGELHKAHDREAVELWWCIIEKRNDRDLCREQPFHTGDAEDLKMGKSMNIVSPGTLSERTVSVFGFVNRYSGCCSWSSPLKCTRCSLLQW